MTTRVVILSVTLLCGALAMAGARGPGIAPAREPLATFPARVGAWTGRDEAPLSQADIDMLRLDDYLSRLYEGPENATVGLYIGYHLQGGFHSPLNCLPGSGWIPVKTTYADIPVAGSESRPGNVIRVNRLILLKGIDKQVVLYWYQGCGRVVASEYWELLFGMVDKIRLGRTDAALVRIMTPAASLDQPAEDDATRTAAEFARMIFPSLRLYIPD